MKNSKKFAACIYLRDGSAVRSLTDRSIISGDPVSLALRYSQSGADAILVFDQSESDAAHEDAIGIIRSICAQCGVPVYGAGRINRLEDVKKLIYAGCAKAALNFSREDNIGMIREAAERFGQDQIAVCYREADDIRSHADLIQDYVSELILINEKNVRRALQIEEVPSILMLPEISLDKVLEFMNLDSVSGIAGNAVNDNAAQIMDLKRLCEENGIGVALNRAEFSWADLKKDPQGLIPVIVQEAGTDEVLMMAYMDKDAYEQTIETGRMTYWSRSRRELWVKGETSGHYQYVKSLTVDCDLDTILAKVEQVGAACHTGHHSCFFQPDLVVEEASKAPNPMEILESDYSTILHRRDHPKEGSYTNYLFDKGIDKMLKKLGEECTEIVIAAKNDDRTETIYEIADLMYHLMVVMAEKDIDWGDIRDEMVRRSKTE